MEIYVIRRLVGMARMLSVRGTQRTRLYVGGWVGCVPTKRRGRAYRFRVAGVSLWEAPSSGIGDVSLSELVKRVGEIDSRQ